MLPALHSLQQAYPAAKPSTILPPISQLLDSYPSHYSSQTLHQQQQLLQLHHRTAPACYFPLLDRLRSSAMDSHVPSPVSPNRMDGSHSAVSSTSSTPSLCSDDASARSIPFISKVLPTPSSFTSDHPSDSTLCQPILQQQQSTFQPPALHQQHHQQHTQHLFTSFPLPQPTTRPPVAPKSTPKVHAPLSDRARLAYFQLANLSSLVNLSLLSPVLKPPTSSSPIPPLLVNSRRHLALRTFCERIFISTRLSPPVVILALRYVHRLVMRASATSSPAPTYFASTLPTGLKLSPRALLIVSLLLANKFLEDQRYSNATWARLGGLPLDEINRAERECLAALAYDLTVSESEYARWLKELEGIVDAAKRVAPPAAASGESLGPAVAFQDAAEGSDKHALLAQLLMKTEGKQSVTEVVEAERVKMQVQQQQHARVMARTKMWVVQQQQAAAVGVAQVGCGGKAVGRARDARMGYMPY